MLSMFLPYIYDGQTGQVPDVSMSGEYGPQSKDHSSNQQYRTKNVTTKGTE